MDSNLYFHPTDPHWMDEHLSEMRAIGKEKTSLFWRSSIYGSGRWRFQLSGRQPRTKARY